MTLVNQKTRDLLIDLYKLASFQDNLNKKDLVAEVNWEVLLKKIEHILVLEGLEIPILPKEEDYGH